MVTPSAPILPDSDARDGSLPHPMERHGAARHAERDDAPTSNLTDEFNIEDNGVPIFSPTCAGQHRVKMTATFSAEVFDPTVLFAI